MRRPIRATAASAAFLLVLFTSVAAAAADPLVWIEAETPAAASFPFKPEPSGRPQLLSGGAWLTKSIEGDATGQIPAGGYQLKYNLDVPAAGAYELWGRVGFEWVRAPMEWRLGEGSWEKAAPTVATTSVMALSDWTEVGWLKLADRRELKAGPTTLEVRVTESNEKRLLFSLDCFTLAAPGTFHPEGKLRPGEQYATDEDRQAAEKIYALPDAKASERSRVEMTGLWQVARYDDPIMDSHPYRPVSELPDEKTHTLRWSGIAVPKSLWDEPETTLAHRVIYRTKVAVPASQQGRAFKLEFGGTNWIASVFVNGQLAGTHKGSWIPWDLDVTKFIKPGETNDLAVAIKGPYYAIDTASMKTTLVQRRNTPRTHARHLKWVTPVHPTTKGDGDGLEYGLVLPVTFVSAGDAYVGDVFVKTLVARKRIETDVTVRNTSARERTFQVTTEALNDSDGNIARKVGPVDVRVAAGADAVATVAGEWADPRLWWPVPTPHLYRLRTTISENGKPLDVHEQRFGFREVTVDGTSLLLNGVRRNLWNWVDPQGSHATGESWVEQWRKEGNRFVRVGADLSIGGVMKSRRNMLELFDRTGVPGRLTSMIDGMFITFDLGRDDGQGNFVPNAVVWENFREHAAQMARAYRNHPSILLYQIENELVYINGQNIYGRGKNLDVIQAEMNKVVEAARKEDPTRPMTVGGAGDLAGRLEIHGPHYPEGPPDWYPQNAYTIARVADHVSVWGPWKRDKPWQVGESLFADELALGSYAAGDPIYRSREDANAGKARYLRMVYGGYRWAGVSAFFPWDNLAQFDDSRKNFSDLAAIPWKQTSRLYAGRTNELKFKVMNDTLSDAPVRFEWSYAVAGDQRAAGDRVELKIKPGFGEERTLSIAAPKTDKRLDARLTLKVTQPGAPDFVDVRDVPILPRYESIQAKGILVLDRSGKLDSLLKATGGTANKIDSLDALQNQKGLLLIGPDTLTDAEAAGTKLLAFAARGGRVIVLEQDNPPAGGNFPVSIQSTGRQGGYAHPQALGTPAFRDLDRDDLIDWAADHPTFKNAYLKPAQGARSLVVAGPELTLAPLIEVPAGDGVIVACQLRVGANLGVDPAADVLLRNLIDQYATYTPAREAVALVGDDAPLANAVNNLGLHVKPVANVADALDAKAHGVVVVPATPANLAALQSAKTKLGTYQQAGGWVVLCNVGPDGIEPFNALMGTRHLLRPFRVERVTLEAPQFPLAATLGNRDLAMFAAKEIMHGRMWVSGETYTHVIDGPDAGPFTLPPGAPDDPFAYRPTFSDNDPYNFVNGMINADDWRYIRQLGVKPGGGGGDPIVFRLRQPETIARINLWNNTNYHTIERMKIWFDDDPSSAVTVTLPDAPDKTEVKLDAPRKATKTISLQVETWRKRKSAGAGGTIDLVGLDNVQFLRVASPGEGVFIDNAGGLVAFPYDASAPSAGGVLLSQLKFDAPSDTPANHEKKRRILGTILRNAGAGAAAEGLAMPGVNVRYQPVALAAHCNQFMKDTPGKTAWFGEKGRDLKELPVGEQRFADVMYDLVRFTTAPAPDCIVLAAPGAPQGLSRDVRGIAVGRKADVLFFLHAAKVTRPIRDDERRRIGAADNAFVPPEVARYMIRYADGRSAGVRVVLGRDVDHWEQPDPDSLEGARVAWTQPGEPGQRRPTLYSMQVKNPYPDATIETIDVELGDGADRAVPALLAITTGQVQPVE